jgi:hypothetical protein
MEKMRMKMLIMLLSLCISITCFARGGGFGGGRSSYSGSRSYSAPSRSYSAPITRSVPRYTSVPTSTVIHTYERPSSNGGFLTGMLMGHMMNNQQPVIVAPMGQQQTQAPVYQQPVYSQPDTGIGFFGYLVIITLLLGAAFIVYSIFVRE